MRWIDAGVLVAVGLIATGVQEAMPTADVVLADLKAGNARHVAKKYERPNQTAGLIGGVAVLLAASGGYWWFRRRKAV